MSLRHFPSCGGLAVAAFLVISVAPLFWLTEVVCLGSQRSCTFCLPIWLDRGFGRWSGEESLLYPPSPVSFFLLSHWISCWTSWLGLQPFLPACSLPCSSSSSSKKARAVPESGWWSPYRIFVTTCFPRAIASSGFLLLVSKVVSQ